MNDLKAEFDQLTKRLTEIISDIKDSRNSGYLESISRILNDSDIDPEDRYVETILIQGKTIESLDATVRHLEHRNAELKDEIEKDRSNPINRLYAQFGESRMYNDLYGTWNAEGKVGLPSGFIDRVIKKSRLSEPEPEPVKCIFDRRKETLKESERSRITVNDIIYLGENIEVDVYFGSWNRKLKGRHILLKKTSALHFDKPYSFQYFYNGTGTGENRYKTEQERNKAAYDYLKKLESIRSKTNKS